MASQKTPVLTPTETEWIRESIKNGSVHDFYIWSKWDAVREAVLDMDHHECVLCRKRGRYAKAVIVHHVLHLRTRPDLALSIYQDDGKTRQLISVCRDCHLDLHGRKPWQIDKKRFVRVHSADRYDNEERW